MNPSRHIVALLALILLAPLALAAPEKWQKEIDAFVAQDAAQAPKSGGAVFVGSSSIRMWKTLAEDFPETHVVNRGFGGSQLEDSIHFFDQLVRPHAPRIVVLYAGENDLASGKTPENVLADFQAFSAKIHDAFPEARVAYIAIKPSPSRWKLREEMIRTNSLIAADCAKDSRRVFVDIFTPMLDANGQPRPELFIKDMLHLNDAGYDVWTRAIAPVLKP